jgi:hypothetical protein
LISEDYKRNSWYGDIFTEILTIQTQLNAETPDVQTIISSVDNIGILVQTKNGKTFRTTFGSISNHTDNILDVIETIGNHFKLILISTPKGPGHKQTQMRPMASLLRRLRQCA